MKRLSIILITLSLLSLQVSAQSVLKMTGGKIKINGNAGIVLKNSSWGNDGGELVTDTGTVTFSGTLSDTIGGSTQTTFGRLIMNKNGGEVHVNTATTVSDSLDLSQGLMVLDDQNLSILPGASTSEGSSDSYVKTAGTGTMTQEVGAQYVLFPVGGNAYRPAAFDNTGITDTYQVRVTDSVLENGANGPRITNEGVDATWYIGEANPGGSVIGLTLQWNQGDELTDFVRNDAYISHYTTSWDIVAPSTTVGSNPYQTQRSGLTNTGLFAILASDEDPPLITCPANIVQSNDPGKCNAMVTYQVPVGTDNAFGAVTALSSGQGSGNAFSVGISTETYTVTDRTGNTASCSFTITVNDTELPVITCPSNIVQSNDLGRCDAIVNYSVSSSDNCGVQALNRTEGLPSGSSYAVGTTVNHTYEIPDDHGNTASCSFSITINDTEAPVATCPQHIVQGNDLGVSGAAVTYLVATTDNCPSESLVQIGGQATGTIFPIGTTTNTFEVTDAAGNSHTCSFDVTINDVELPVITCPQPIVQGNDVGNCDAVVSYTISTSDNAAGEVWMQTGGIASGNIFPLGNTYNSFKVTDASGNTATCDFTVTVEDTTHPEISCPPNMVLSNDTDVCGVLLNYNAPIGTDNCAAPVTSRTTGLGPGVSFPGGVTVETYEVVDGSGNTASCAFSVTVNDVDNPVFVCPTSNVVRLTDLGMCDHLAVGQDLDPVVSDNCQVQTLVNDYNQSSSLDGAAFSKGKTLVTWTAIDPSGNSAVCSYNIKVNDKEAPTFDNCPDDTTITIPFNAGGSYYTWPALTATDNCNGPNQLTIAGFPLSGSYFSVGTMAVNWTATDKKNNTQTCDFEVTVVEQGAPAPGGWTAGGIGTSNTCSTNYDALTSTATIVTSGGNLNTTSDQFCSITFPTSDQVIDFRARVTPPGGGYYDQAGIMMRQGLTANAAHAAMYLTGTGVPIMALRASAGTMPLGTSATAVATPYWVRLYRSGGVIAGFISADGVNWSLVKNYPNLISSPLYLVIFSKTAGALGTATIDQISVNGIAAREGLMEKDTELSLKAYPNPFSEDLFLEVANALPREKYEVRLSNMLGQRVYGYETGASPEGKIEQRISLAHLAAGTYLLEVSAGVQRKTLKVVKQ